MPSRVPQGSPRGQSEVLCWPQSSFPFSSSVSRIQVLRTVSLSLSVNRFSATSQAPILCLFSHPSPSNSGRRWIKRSPGCKPSSWISQEALSHSLIYLYWRLFRPSEMRRGFLTESASTVERNITSLANGPELGQLFYYENPTISFILASLNQLLFPNQNFSWGKFPLLPWVGLIILCV